MFGCMAKLDTANQLAGSFRFKRLLGGTSRMGIEVVADEDNFLAVCVPTLE